jgi:two-component system response regulator GlrR
MQEPFSAMVHRSAIMRTFLDAAREAAQRAADLLVEGESGTGKETLAREIHAASPRRAGPFVAIRCGEIPDALVEGELFGYAWGGVLPPAHGGVPGLLARASGGTAFLDEVWALPSETQAALLAALETRLVTPVGGRAQQPIDVRVIASTTLRLDDLADEGRFDRQLLRRIASRRLRVPPLRERPEDIPVLVEHMLSRASPWGVQEPKGLAHGVIDLLVAHPWPGNFRELMLVLEIARAQVGQRALLDVGDLPWHLRKTGDS